MKENQLRALLDKHIDTFISNIAIELENSHDKWFDGFGFPMFGETSKQYHEQVYFQSYLESYTRQLINGILKEILEDEFAAEFSWPEFEHVGTYKGYSNIECEQEFGFQFIDRNEKVGYRYTFFHDDEIEGLLSKGKVESVTLVVWQNKDEIIGFEYEDERVRIILLWDLFHELFWGLEENEISTMYNLFTTKVTKAVERAQSMISLTTLPGFTPSYLYKTRNQTVEELAEDVGTLSCFTVNNDDFKQNEYNSIQLIDNYKLADVFLANGFENVFVGTSDFAKSYLTSEYLRRFFKDNPMFDYTPIVSGYLKSIEQLLHTICESYYKGKGIVVDFSEYTLGTYITDLRKARIFKREFLGAKNYIIACLNSYRAENRNNLFHKDYFNSWDKVEQIRTNTIFLYVVLLGAIETDLITKDPTVLGILDIRYDQLFCMIEEHKNEFFTLVIDGKEYTNMERVPRYKGLAFTENGLIMNSLVFKKFDYDHYETVELSRNNMPSSIWTTSASGEKLNQIWPQN